MVDAGFHLRHLVHLDVEEVEEAGGEGVDLVSHTGQRLSGVILGLLQGISLVFSL